MVLHIVVGVLLFIIGGAIFAVSLDNAINETFSLGVFFGAAIATFGVVWYIIGLSDLADKSDQRDQRAKVRNTQITKTCNPYAVTHRHENGGYIVYSCANDNKIRVVKK